ncbi:MAG TPA: hypothetical protein VJU15_13265 [Gemmatimonadales bacterium]|nr:hypothetical protein [Gemmatimonadales bacterium]
MDDALKVFIILAGIGLAGTVTYASIALVHAFISRIKGGAPDVTSDELEYLRDRAEQVDSLSERVVELETRLDFAERLLTRPEDERRDTPVGSG